MHGSKFRALLFFTTALPLATLFDMNGGIHNFGFKKTDLKKEYKVKPDYITGKLFVAQR